MHIGPNTKSPISLLEFGQYISDDKLFIVCDKSFFRYNNLKLTQKETAHLAITMWPKVFIVLNFNTGTYIDIMAKPKKLIFEIGKRRQVEKPEYLKLYHDTQRQNLRAEVMILYLIMIC